MKMKVKSENWKNNTEKNLEYFMSFNKNKEWNKNSSQSFSKSLNLIIRASWTNSNLWKNYNFCEIFLLLSISYSSENIILKVLRLLILKWNFHEQIWNFLIFFCHKLNKRKEGTLHFNNEGNNNPTYNLNA